MRSNLGLPRLMPAAMLATGMTLAAYKGEAVVHDIVDFVKVVLTRHEMAQMAQSLQLESIQEHGSVLLLEDPNTLAGFIRRHATTSRADPAIDLWGHAYVAERQSNALRYQLRSLGPNGARDKGCDSRSSGAPDVVMPIPEQSPLSDKPTGTSSGGSQAAGDDDLCIIVVMEPGK